MDKMSKGDSNTASRNRSTVTNFYLINKYSNLGDILR